MTGLCDALPRVRLASLPTPFEEAPRLTAALGGPRLFFKRDDLTGLALGGNKSRKLEFIMGDVRRHGCDAIITTADAQSNFCRAAAAAASRLGVQTFLLLRGTGREARQGNLLLDGLFWADIRFIPFTDPWDPRIVEAIEALAAELRARGLKPYIVQLPGRTAPLAVAAYVDAAEELHRQWQEAGWGSDALYVACGSGLTLAGLALGLKHLGHPTRVVGISVQQPAARLGPWVVDKANAAAELLGLPTGLTPGDFDLLDDYIGQGYGIPSPESVAAVRLVGRTEGVLLDPVYTGKAMGGLIDRIRQGIHRPGQTVAFLHSGGAPGVFAHAQAFTPATPA